jgi:hypothetical protein
VNEREKLLNSYHEIKSKLKKQNGIWAKAVKEFLEGAGEKAPGNTEYNSRYLS